MLGQGGNAAHSWPGWAPDLTHGGAEDEWALRLFSLQYLTGMKVVETEMPVESGRAEAGSLRGGGAPCLTVLLSVPAVCDHGLLPDPAPHGEAGARRRL